MVHFIVYTNNVYTDNVDTGEDTPMRHRPSVGRGEECARKS